MAHPVAKTAHAELTKLEKQLKESVTEYDPDLDSLIDCDNAGDVELILECMDVGYKQLVEHIEGMRRRVQHHRLMLHD